MKLFLKRKIFLIFALVFAIPILCNQNTAVVSAAAKTPTFVKGKVEIVGAGETYQLAIKDKVAKSKYSWSSSNKSVAKVSSKGLVTSVNKGTATVKCKITYPSKKTKTLSCKVTVTIPAKEITISNAPLVNGAYQLSIGSTMDFNYTVTPANTSDKAYWYIEQDEAGCIRMDNAAEGIITGIKAGKASLRVKAAKAATKAAAAKSTIDDSIIIEVVAPTATVKSADIISSNEIKVVFDSPVNSNTVIGANKKLSENIDISIRKNVKGVWAQDPGALTAVLSSDGRTLTITTEKMLSGEYGINFSSKILTTEGLPLEEYYKQLSYIDTVAPYYINTTLDDTGMIATINFNEVIDFTNFKVMNPAVVPSGTMNSVTSSILSTTSNYIVNEDKKSVSINLSNIAQGDHARILSVTITGIKDMAGNIPASFALVAYLQTDNTPKPQARLINIVRTSYNTLTANFDRAIKFGGYLQIGGAQMVGVIDAKDGKKVNFTITEAQAQLTGIQKVSIGFWNSYNVISTDTSANTYVDRMIDFTADRTSPFLVNYAYDAATGILTLTYNEEVTLRVASGIFSSTFSTTNGEIRPGNNINYASINHSEGNNIIKLKITNMNLIGTYNFALEQGFAIDSFNNQAMRRELTISSQTSTELPAPDNIYQSPDNLSQIYIHFTNMVDKQSAETISNYSIAGVPIQAAELKINASDLGATVVLTVADGAITISTPRPITIAGVKGHNNYYTAITAYTRTIDLKENLRPSYQNATYNRTTNSVILNFSEQITGSMTFKVTQTLVAGQVPIDYTGSITVTGNTVVLNLTGIPVNNYMLKVDIITTNIKDLTGNTAILPASIPVQVY